jgi:hypothetical protein
MDYVVTCEKGISYLESGPDGGDSSVFKKGATIREADVLKGLITAPALERLEREGRVARVEGQKDKSVKGLQTK